ncbi:MAG: hypothetical protein ACKVOM_06505, partial [Ferruginibacter sp.]
MKKGISIKMIIVLFICHFSQIGFTQITPERLAQYILDQKWFTSINAKRVTEITSFYEQLKFQTAWIDTRNKEELSVLLKDIKLSPGLGLNEKEYQHSFI